MDGDRSQNPAYRATLLKTMLASYINVRGQLHFLVELIYKPELNLLTFVGRNVGSVGKNVGRFNFNFLCFIKVN